MGRKKDVSFLNKNIILTLRKEGLTQQRIARKVNCSQGTVSKILQDYYKNKKLKNNRENCGSKRITSKRQDRCLRRITTKYRFRSVNFINNKWRESGVDASVTTTRRRIHEFGFRSRVPKKKPFLSAKQKRRRLMWCRERLSWGTQEWNKVLFSDESVFCVSVGPQRNRVWRFTHEAFQANCLKRTVKFSTSIMVWGCFSVHGLGKLCILKGSVNSEAYKAVLDNFMIPASEDLFEGDFIFQQDSASCHTSKTTMSWLKNNNIQLLPWPVNSPDLNPIENIWGLMKKNNEILAPKDQNELIKFVKLVWDNISKDQCKKLVQSMPDRLRDVIKAKGDATKF